MAGVRIHLHVPLTERHERGLAIARAQRDSGHLCVGLCLVPLTLSAEMVPPELPAYGRILLDVLNANSALSIREAEEAWRVVEGWARGLAPLESYDAGSDGPPGR